jgi:hypothetical protein
MVPEFWDTYVSILNTFQSEILLSSPLESLQEKYVKTEDIKNFGHIEA